MYPKESLSDILIQKSIYHALCSSLPYFHCLDKPLHRTGPKLVFLESSLHHINSILKGQFAGHYV